MNNSENKKKSVNNNHAHSVKGEVIIQSADIAIDAAIYTSTNRPIENLPDETPVSTPQTSTNSIDYSVSNKSTDNSVVEAITDFASNLAVEKLNSVGQITSSMYKKTTEIFTDTTSLVSETTKNTLDAAGDTVGRVAELAESAAGSVVELAGSAADVAVGAVKIVGEVASDVIGSAGDIL